MSFDYYNKYVTLTQAREICALLIDYKPTIEETINTVYVTCSHITDYDLSVISKKYPNVKLYHNNDTLSIEIEPYKHSGVVLHMFRVILLIIFIHTCYKAVLLIGTFLILVD